MQILFNGTLYNISTNAKGFLLTEQNNKRAFYADINSLIFIINLIALSTYFPSLYSYNLPPEQAVRLVGIRQGPTTAIVVNILIKYIIEKGEEHTFDPVTTYIVPKLPGYVLLGIDFLRGNSLNIK